MSNKKEKAGGEPVGLDPRVFCALGLLRGATALLPVTQRNSSPSEQGGPLRRVTKFYRDGRPDVAIESSDGVATGVTVYQYPPQKNINFRSCLLRECLQPKFPVNFSTIY